MLGTPSSRKTQSNLDFSKSGGGYIWKSGQAKQYTFQKFRGGGGGAKGDLEKSRFDWVFLDDGVPKTNFREIIFNLDML